MRLALLALVLLACGRNDRVDEATVVPGAALGPVRLGMSRAEVEAIDLPFHYDPSAQGGDQAIFAGPYQLVLDPQQRVEQVAITLSRVRHALVFGERRLLPSATFADLVQAFGPCDAPLPYEGGQRARCAQGGVFIEQGMPAAPPRVRVLHPR